MHQLDQLSENQAVPVALVGRRSRVQDSPRAAATPRADAVTQEGTFEVGQGTRRHQQQRHLMCMHVHANPAATCMQAGGRRDWPPAERRPAGRACPIDRTRPSRVQDTSSPHQANQSGDAAAARARPCASHKEPHVHVRRSWALSYHGRACVISAPSTSG
jgi:hypothetical protein